MHSKNWRDDVHVQILKFVKIFHTLQVRLKNDTDISEFTFSHIFKLIYHVCLHKTISFSPHLQRDSQ
jgi:hypothetical protein